MTPAFEGEPMPRTISLSLEVSTQKFNGRWQAWYGSRDGRLLVFNCPTEGTAMLKLASVLRQALDDAR